MREMFIDATKVTISKGWTINDQINARTQMAFTVTDKLLLSQIDEGDSVEFKDGTDVLFSGVIKNIVDFEPWSGTIWHQIQADDASALADKRIIADAIENQTPGYIVTNHILPILAEEGVTAGTIETGSILKKVVFDYVSVSAALDTLQSLTGFNWTIDKDKKLQFFRRDQNFSDYNVTDKSPVKTFSRQRSMNQYRNKQYVRAGKGKTSIQTAEKPTPEPDGISRNFVLRFPIAEKPIISINSVAVDPANIGINGIDENKEWYFSFNSNVVSQDESETVLTASDTIEVTYKGLYPILAVVDIPEQIDDRKAKETGTSGIYEVLTQETSIDTTEQAVEYANGLVSKYGQVQDIITYDIENIEVVAGTLQRITKSLFNVDDYFLIESVSTFEEENQVVYQVKALDGSALGGWEVFFKDLIKGSRQSVVTLNEVLIILNTQIETNKYSGNIEVISSPGLHPANDLYPSETLYPNIIATNEGVLND